MAVPLLMPARPPLKRRIDRIVIHTAAAASRGRPVDQEPGTLKAWWLKLGWTRVGYHRYIRFDGRVYELSDLERQTNGVEGMNAHSAHVCFSGHGDFAAPTEAQWKSSVGVVCDIALRSGLAPTILVNPMRVLGHRECYALLGVPRKNKSCPGKLVDMSAFRRDVVIELRRRLH